ncbi:MAG: hypothetical protein ACYTEL_12365 [Planctomycetota bacterium]|jgi:hypothetical protein
MGKNLARMTFTWMIAGALLPAQGCGPCDVACPALMKMQGQPFSFRVNACQCPSLRPHVLRAWASEWTPEPIVPSPFVRDKCDRLDVEPLWEIIARKPVKANGFVLTIGQVPDGFDQVIPAAGQIFMPVSGKEYRLEIETDWPCYQNYGTPRPRTRK